MAGIAGFFIGCIGIGGVLLVPGLTFGGVEIHEAIAASLFSYIFCAAVGGLDFRPRGLDRVASARRLCLSAMPAAFAGAIVAAEIRAERARSDRRLGAAGVRRPRFDPQPRRGR